MPPQRLPDSEAASADRDEMLTLLDETIQDVCDRIRSYEVESPEDERMLIKWHRTLATHIGQY